MPPIADLSPVTLSHAVRPTSPHTARDRRPLHRAARRGCKRAIDCGIALVLLVLLCPLLVVIAAGVRADSPGPALFRQTRIGRGNRPFVILKFRTMRADAAGPVPEQGPERVLVQARPADPRLTRLGGTLRRTSLDELPQLWNVLRGEMALVGPRPHAPGTPAAGHPIERIPGYDARHAVRPGLTGLAQVRGYRGLTDTQAKAQARLDSDLEYVRSWSVRKDLSILARTAIVIVRGINAV